MALASCGGESGSTVPSSPAPPPPAPRRTWRMGFSPNPPRPTVDAVLRGIDQWSTRAELAIIHEELPWADLLSGMTPDAILARDKVDLVALLRRKGLAITVMLDLTNGLDRATEARALTTAGRSLTEPAVQDMAKAFALAVQSRLSPDNLGLSAETNLIRRIAPAGVYHAVRTTAASIESALAASGATSRRFISVQAESAWGHLGGAGVFEGIAQDRADFPFMRALGISSYPYLAFADPADVPSDYFTRLRDGSSLPVIVTEGGWSSASGSSFVSSPEKQARYISRFANLLDSVSASAWFQLQYSDMDTTAFPPELTAILSVFASIGLTDAVGIAKPALAQWDALFARALA